MKRITRAMLIGVSVALVLASGVAVSGSAPTPKVDVRVDGLAFEPGAGVALELVSTTGAECFPRDLLVEQVELADAQGNLISVVSYSTFNDASDWLGVVMLRAGDGSDLPPGAYEIHVVTSSGTFIAGLNVVPAAQFASLDRFVAGVPVCSTTLRAYRLVTELDANSRVTMRVGDRMMVLLAGNPTTGYSWSDSPIYDNSPLQLLDEAEYRSQSDLLGAGGFYLYRYWATEAGTQDFHYEYRRSWESVAPILTFEFTADVR